MAKILIFAFGIILSNFIYLEAFANCLFKYYPPIAKGDTLNLFYKRLFSSQEIAKVVEQYLLKGRPLTGSQSDNIFYEFTPLSLSEFIHYIIDNFGDLNSLISAIIYVDRIIEKGKLQLTHQNAYLFFLVAFGEADKMLNGERYIIFEKQSYLINALISKLSKIKLPEYNELEVAFLMAIDYNLFIYRNTYESYLKAFAAGLSNISMKEIGSTEIFHSFDVINCDEDAWQGNIQLDFYRVSSPDKITPIPDNKEDSIPTQSSSSHKRTLTTITETELSNKRNKDGHKDKTPSDLKQADPDQIENVYPH